MFTDVLNAGSVRFSEDPDIWRYLVFLKKDVVMDGLMVDSLACVRGAVWGMLKHEWFLSRPEGLGIL